MQCEISHCITYVTFSDRQHVEAQVAVISFYLESDDVVKTSGSVGFAGNAHTPWTSASCKCYQVLWMSFFDIH